MSVGLILAGRYRLISKLGQGGMGSVWRAEDLNLGAQVAIKLIDPAFAQSTEALQRFKREAQSAATIRSTYVVQILDHGVDNGTPFIAMELLNGESLAQRLESVSKLSPERTGRVLGHAGRALELAHEHGIVHRDMKPDNVFLVREGEDDVGKVLDFGIARQAGGLSEVGALKTQTGAILGTPYYMSPEQATGQPVDQLTDIWSFGVIASECLTGRRAFESESLGGLFHAICMAPLPVPSQCGPVPAGFDEWFARAVARDKTARYQTIKEAAADLRTICGRGSRRPASTGSSTARQDVGQSLGSSVAVAGANVPRYPNAPGLQTTAVPSSVTMTGSPTSRKKSAVPLAIAAVAIVGGGLFVGWRTLSKSEPTAASAPLPLVSAAAVVASVSAVAAPSAATVVPVASKPAPLVIGQADAGVDLAKAPEPATAAPRPVFIAKRRAGAAATPAPAPAEIRETPPAANVKKPVPKRDDNAAGI